MSARSELAANIGLQAGIQGSGRSLTDRRANIQQQIDFYRQQARLARQGLATRDEGFYLRQIQYFELFC